MTREIENVNQSLIALGHTDIVIGSKLKSFFLKIYSINAFLLNLFLETTTNEIKSFIRSCTNSTLVSQLNQLLPNFEIHSNQELLIKYSLFF